MHSEETSTYTDVDNIPFLAVSFPVQGRQLLADHGYLLYAAIIKHVPSLHSAAWLGIELISGLPWGKGIIALPAHSTSLRLRLPADKLAHVLRLAGVRLEIDGYPLRLGIPVARPLVPASSLYARIVTIKKRLNMDSRELITLPLVRVTHLAPSTCFIWSHGRYWCHDTPTIAPRRRQMF